MQKFDSRPIRNAVLVLILFAGFASGGANRSHADDRGANDSAFLVPNVFADLADQTLPSVVSVYVKLDIRGQLQEFREQMEPFLDDPRLKKFFEQEEGKDPHKNVPESRASGSGVIITSDGYIVTNNHIVGGAKEGQISIVLNDDTEIPGSEVKLIATDPYLDLAVLKIDGEGKNLKPLVWGDSDRMKIGDWVMAIGNPLDLRGSVSQGIISAKSRKIGKAAIEHLIQTDAMINPGNSGGALVNLRGELIGINMAIATNSGFFQGIGFAIPSNDAQFITDQIIKEGRIKRGYIGIRMKELEDPTLRKALGMGPDHGGILVTEAVAGAPASDAGVESYDIISHVDGIKIEDTSDLLSIIASKRVGELAELSILRRVNGKTHTVSLDMKVSERPPDSELGSIRSADWERINDEPIFSGLRLRTIHRGDMTAMEITSVESRSFGEQAGLSTGDIILEINRKPVGSEKDVEEALDDIEDGEPILIRFERRNGVSEVVALTRN